MMDSLSVALNVAEAETENAARYYRASVEVVRFLWRSVVKPRTKELSYEVLSNVRKRIYPVLEQEESLGRIS